MRLILFLLFTGIAFAASSQVNVGAWRDHLPYSHCIKVVKIGTKIYCATSHNIFTYNTQDNSIQKLSKITGLSDIGISTIAYNPDKNTLLIAYSDGNIDLLKDQQISNMPDVLNHSMTGSKKANHIFFSGDYAYISYSFGILVLNIEKMEVKDTYQVGEAGTAYEVLSVTADDNYFYAATAKGLFKADVNNQLLVDYNQWQRDNTIPASTGKFNFLENYNGKIIANSSGALENSDTLYYLEDDTWKRIANQYYYTRREVKQSDDKLLVTCSNHVFLLDEELKPAWIFDDYGFYQADPYSSLMDESGNVWVADTVSGLVVKTANAMSFQNIIPNGPYSEIVRDMHFKNNTLYVTGGGADVSWNNLFNPGMLYTFKDESWTSAINWDVVDYTVVTADPTDSETAYVGAWGSGVWIYKNGQAVTNYTEKNSTLQTNITGEAYVRIGGLVFDENNNLWVTNSGVSSPISVMKTDGTWKSFEWGSYINCTSIGNITVDKNGMFWVVLPYQTGLFVFDINGTVDNEKDDQYLKFKPQNALDETISNVYCITNDLDGNVWVGTDQGPVVYSSPETVLSGETAGTQITIPRNDGTDNADVLLGTETINCIAVDGANRKWFGTKSGGAYLFTADGAKQVYHFNTTNSPIFSNTVNSIAINDETGEVFFGTDKGIISYRATATAADEDFTNVYVFPNPVRDDYDGVITITGLIENTIVKITDISGNLVYQTKSLGGQATWDGKTHGGRRVATGVYLVFCSNEDGSKTFVTKMLVIH